MKESYREGLQLSWKNGSSWKSRIIFAALRIYTATCFRETSGEYLSKMSDDRILPPIGYYYSLFHMGVAMLYLEHTTEIKQIQHSKEKPLTHRKIIDLMDRKLASRGYISNEFLDLLSKLKQIREQINYGFRAVHSFTKEEKLYGIKIDKEERIFLGTLLNESYVLTGTAFDEAFEYIGLISDTAGENDNGATIGQELEGIIADSGWIDDLGPIYLSEDVSSRVISYLLDKDLMH